MEIDTVSDKPYWADKPGTAPVKAEFVLWDKLRSSSNDAAKMRDFDDDAAEGRTKVTQTTLPAAAAAESSTSSGVDNGGGDATATNGVESSRNGGGATTVEGGRAAASEEPPAKKVKLSGAQKKHLAKARAEEAWQRKKAEREALVAENGGGGGGAPKKQGGQNKNRKFDNQAGVNIRLCNPIALGRECERSPCRYSHDIAAFLAQREEDVPITLPDTPPVPRECPLWLKTGWCPYGFKCRFGDSHMRKVEDGQGFKGCGWELVKDEEKARRWKSEKQPGWSSDKGEMNTVSAEVGRGAKGASREEKYPLTAEYLHSVGEPMDIREAGAKNQREHGTKKPAETSSEAKATVYTAVDDDDGTSAPSTSTAPPADIVASADNRLEVDIMPPRAREKRRLDFKGKLYMAPLTTVGNLPFRRLAVELGCDITCSEMGLAQEFLNGNSNEWSLVRRHPSEKLFGIQICGNRPQVLVPAAEQIVKHCDIDFLDLNTGCPIDLVFNKGGGSALLGHQTKLGRSLVGMSRVLGEVPMTIKIRTGIQHSNPVAHKLVTRIQKEWEVSAVTLHGRSRQQRYKTKADYNYIGECVKSLRDVATEVGAEPITFFGNGDAYDYRSYYENMEASGVDGIMIARGALVKPWIFTEIKERRDWDISSRERLDMIGKLASYGLEHWGSDTQGLNTTRRFLLEALSFQCRYVPVGLLERFPVQLNERPYPYRGRDDIETLLASDQSTDWIKISSMFLGPPPESWSFQPKHKSNATGDADAQG